MPPPRIQTRRSWDEVWRNLALSAEFMKMPDPMIAPLTIMAASKAPSFRLSEVSFILLFYPKEETKSTVIGAFFHSHILFSRVRANADAGFDLVLFFL
jgi:hypothetical protein